MPQYSGQNETNKIFNSRHLWSGCAWKWDIVPPVFGKKGSAQGTNDLDDVWAHEVAWAACFLRNQHTTTTTTSQPLQ